MRFTYIFSLDTIIVSVFYIKYQYLFIRNDFSISVKNVRTFNKYMLLLEEYVLIIIKNKLPCL